MDNLTIREGFVGQRTTILPVQIQTKLKSNEITRYFYITDLGYYPNAKNHLRQRSAGAQEFIFIYCTEGKGWLQVGEEEKVRVRPNHYCIIPKDEMHSYGADPDNPWSIYWMHFDGRGAITFYERYALNNNRIVPIPFSNRRIQLFDQISKALNSGYLELELEYACMMSLNFLNSFIYHNISRSIDTAHHENLVNAIKAFINQNLDKALKAEDIAAEFEYSNSYIFSAFKKSTGYSLIHFFNLKKIQKACEYINYTNLNMKEISHKVGFQDPFYFSRLFKKYMGVSPRGYKKNY